MSDSSPAAPSRNLVDRLFRDHPATVNETYLGHMRFALGFSFWLSIAAMAALIHALIPALCETTASRILGHLTRKMQARH